MTMTKSKTLSPNLNHEISMVKASGCEVAAHLACAAWAATVVWLRLARRRRALAAARERGSLQTGLVLHRGRRGVEQTVEHTAQVRGEA